MKISWFVSNKHNFLLKTSPRCHLRRNSLITPTLAHFDAINHSNQSSLSCHVECHFNGERSRLKCHHDTALFLSDILEERHSKCVLHICATLSKFANIFHGTRVFRWLFYTERCKYVSKLIKLLPNVEFFQDSVARAQLVNFRL